MPSDEAVLLEKHRLQLPLPLNLDTPEIDTLELGGYVLVYTRVRNPGASSEVVDGCSTAAAASLLTRLDVTRKNP
jgi:hypothetical protein